MSPFASDSAPGRKNIQPGVAAFLRSVWTVPAAALCVAVLLLAIQHAHLSEAWDKLFASLVYSALIGLPLCFILSFIGHNYSARFPRLVILMNIMALLLAATVGSFAGAFVLQFTGFIRAGRYWQEIQTSFPIAIVVTLVFGLSITSYETMRHRLQSATLELRTRQVERERANKLLVEARLSSLESRIHPHFLFNTLNSIASLIPSDPRRAEDTVSRLASLLRFSLNANHTSLVPLVQEIKVVREYLEIESTRFGSRLRYQIAVPDKLADIKVPPLALQTLVENSVKHVVSQRADGATVQIDGSMRDGNLNLDVIDDGPGFLLGGVAPEHGLGNLVARLQLLFGDRGKLDILRDDNKTIARITLPAET
jgi:sensor histidine kinase YesM